MTKDEWQPIETMPTDGELILFWSPLAGPFIAPALQGAPPTIKERAEIYKHTGEWTNVGWNPTYWMPLPPPPSGGDNE